MGLTKSAVLKGPVFCDFSLKIPIDCYLDCVAGDASFIRINNEGTEEGYNLLIKFNFFKHNDAQSIAICVSLYG
jgi:hypothetical protein